MPKNNQFFTFVKAVKYPNSEWEFEEHSDISLQRMTELLLYTFDFFSNWFCTNNSLHYEEGRISAASSSYGPKIVVHAYNSVTHKPFNIKKFVADYRQSTSVKALQLGPTNKPVANTGKKNNIKYWRKEDFRTRKSGKLMSLVSNEYLEDSCISGKDRRRSKVLEKLAQDFRPRAFYKSWKHQTRNAKQWHSS